MADGDQLARERYAAMFRQATATAGPLPYQERLALQPLFPSLLDIPTGLGKTAAAIWPGSGAGASPAHRSGIKHPAASSTACRCGCWWSRRSARQSVGWIGLAFLPAGRPGKTPVDDGLPNTSFASCRLRTRPGGFQDPRLGRG